MALTQPTKYRDLVSPATYLVVGGLSINSDKATMTFMLHHRATPESVEFYAENYFAPYTLDGPDPFEQAYIHLKALPEFADATDC